LFGSEPGDVITLMDTPWFVSLGIAVAAAKLAMATSWEIMLEECITSFEYLIWKDYRVVRSYLLIEKGC
jgi:hypothetical protein